MRIAEDAEKQYNGKIIDDDTLIFIMHDIALEGEQKTITTVKYAKRLSFANGPTAIVIPAELSDIEKETIRSMYDINL
jgi:diphthamide biosynthesis methyltransferase